MVELTFREAVRQAIDEEMMRDDRVFILGEEVAEYDGAYKVTQGLLQKYSARRVIDTPIAEEGFTGIGIGAAMMGLRPIVEWMTFNFSLVAIDQVINNAAKMGYMSNGQIKVPIVFRGPNGPAEYLSAQHSQALESYYVYCPGLYVIAPSTPYDAKGLLKSSIRNDNPVVFLESELMYSWKGEVPDHEYTIPLGLADVKRQGTHISLLSYSKPMRIALEAADILAGEGIDVEVIDIRSLRPLDETTIIKSVKKTGVCLVLSESWPMASFASYLAWLVSQRCFDFLDAPVELISCADVSMPYNHTLELHAQPSVDKIIDTVRKMLSV